ncbi:MAG: UMP kinase [Spirochaetaceae bacterium]|nr:UMP kinase [Spirochaetaceae bacterium]
MMYVISLGGSIVSPPSGPDVAFLADFRRRLAAWLALNTERRVILVIGGGEPARSYQAAYRGVLARLAADADADGSADADGRAAAESSAAPEAESDKAMDWIGIAATRLNAQLVKQILGPLCTDDVVTDPSSPIDFSGKVLVASGWKPGFSTDFDAVYLAERFGAKMVLNLSNIAKVYTADPRLHPEATPIDSISWKDFRTLVGSTWSPGANLPFDPIASARAESAGIPVLCAAGRDLDNLFRILDGKAFSGTLIGARQ